MLKTILQAAEFLCVSPRNMRKLIADGHIRKVIIGRLWRVDSDDLDLFIQRHKI
jgi:excisionase family DNA binding protein